MKGCVAWPRRCMRKGQIAVAAISLTGSVFSMTQEERINQEIPSDGSRTRPGRSPMSCRIQPGMRHVASAAEALIQSPGQKQVFEKYFHPMPKEYAP